MDHLETKRQILALREKYGEENWLSSQSAAYVQTIMGLQSPSNPVPDVLSTSELNDHQITSTNLSISPIQNTNPNEMNGKIEVQVHMFC